MPDEPDPSELKENSNDRARRQDPEVAVSNKFTSAKVLRVQCRNLQDRDALGWDDRAR